MNLIRRTDSMLALCIGNRNVDIVTVMKLTVEAKGSAITGFYLD